MKKIFYISFLILIISSCAQEKKEEPKQSARALAPEATLTIDPLEYPPANVSAIDQLKSFPAPRFKSGHTLLPNYNVMDPIYFGGYKQPGISDNTAIDNSIIIQEIMCKDFNYMFSVNWFDGYYSQAAVIFANAHPEYKISAMTLRAQVGGTKLWDQNFANNHYLQNSSGTFLDWSGQATAYPYKVYRPVADFINEYAVDGDVIKSKYAGPLSGLTRNVDFVNEDGEVYPILENYALQSDPLVVTQKNASGLGWQPYLAKNIRLNDNAYRNRFMVGKFAGGTYTEYRLDGHRDYQLAWEEARYINTPINGQYYATGDLYVRWPYNWKDWVSAWHGLRWVSESRHYELAVGDKLFSPFVAAGWSANPEEDVRPAQWLGLMKVMGMYGAEFFYTSYFTESLPAQDPKGYAWQAVIPPYAQAISTRYEDILKSGSLLPGDMINNKHTAYGVSTPIPLYQFNTGDENKVVVIRKKDGVNKYAITGTIQNSSNVINSTPINSECQINLNGQILKFKIRRQGSTYVYDASVVPPVFYQLDGWHQYEHPSYWIRDFEIETENFDVSNGTLKTYCSTAPDYRNFQTVLAMANNQTATYSVSPRESGQKYLFVKAMGTGTMAITFDILNYTMAVSNGWNRVNLGNVSMGNHTFTLKAMGTMEVDSISITAVINKYPVGIPVTCNIPTNIYVNNITNSSCVVHWNYSNSNNTTTLVYLKLPTGKEKIYKKDSTTQNPKSKQINDLKSLTQYSVRARSVCEGDTSDYSTSVPFTTK